MSSYSSKYSGEQIDALLDVVNNNTNSSDREIQAKYFNGTTDLLATKKETVKYSDLIIPEACMNQLGKNVYLGTLSNALYAANKRFPITITFHSISANGQTYPQEDTSLVDTETYRWTDGPILRTLDQTSGEAALFDGGYDSYRLSIPSGQYVKIRIQLDAPFDSNFGYPGYQYGTYYLFSWDTQSPTKVQYRVYNTHSQWPIGWRPTQNAAIYTSDTELANYTPIWYINDGSNCYRKYIEFICFNEKASGYVRLRHIDWKLTRAGIEAKPLILANKPNNKVFGTFDAITLKENGVLLSSKYASSSHTHNYAGSNSAGGPATSVNVGSGTADAYRNIFFADSGSNNLLVTNSNFQYNPSTATIKTANYMLTDKTNNKATISYNTNTDCIEFKFI